ncbi:MAG: dockerin type I domain-containing protein, partial [Rubripirellula sp.]
QPDSQLDSVRLIDIRGTGDNTLMLDAGAILSRFTNGEILVRSDSGDEVVFDDDWNFIQAFSSGGELVRQFVNGGDGATLNLIGPSDFTNPISEFDVNASGDVSALDALVIINELAGRQFSDGGTSPEGGVRDPGSIDLSSFRFYDVTRDLRITALDALRVINQLARQPASSEQVEGELVALQSDSVEVESNDELAIPIEPTMIEPTSRVQIFDVRTSTSDSSTREEAAVEEAEQSEVMSAGAVDAVLRHALDR